MKEFTAYIESLIKMESNSKSSYISLLKPITEKRQKEIRRWIENEQVLCGLDNGYWSTRYAYVCDEKGQIFKYQPRLSQRIIDSVIADFDEKQVSIELLALKGRQLGVTSWTALKFIHRMLFVPHTQAIMASVKASSSELIGRILDTAYNRCPWWLVPRRLPKRAFDNGSILSIQSGMQATGLAQGWTPTAVHCCFSPETLVHTQNGEIKRIVDVSSGDLVLTSKRRLASVRAVVKSSRKDEVGCELSLWGNYDPLVVTRDHPILTPEGFQAAEEIGKHDYVVMPVRPISHTIKTSELTHRPKSRPSKNQQPKKETIKLTREWGWMCGLYLSEGSSHRNTKLSKEHWDAVYFSIHQNEIEDYQRGLQDALGLFQHVHVNRCKTSKTATLVVYSAALTNWLVENFGHLAEGKRIPDWVWSSGKEFIHGLLRGYFEGDGYIPSDSASVVASSISQSLIMQIRNLLASCGFGWGGVYHHGAGIRYGRNCKDRWEMKLHGDYAREFRRAMGFVRVDKTYIPPSELRKIHSSAPKHWRYSSDGTQVWIEVFENRPIECAEFYDLEVNAPEHDFCTVHCCVKNSELADIPDPKRVIEEGLFRATHTSKNLFMVLEGTGGGNTGWLADTWRAAKEDWPKGRSRLCPIFIPWPMCPEIYPQPDWIRKFPIENSWKPMEITRKHVTRCESYVRNTPYLAKVAGSNWKMPIEQQWFWEFNYQSACKNHTQKTWTAQMPADDFESLVGEHDSVFDPEVIHEVESRIYEIKTDHETGQDKKERKKPVQAYAIAGDSIDDGFDPDPSTIDWDKPRIRVTWRSHRGNKYDWEMIPLLPVNEDKESETFDKLLVYEEPQPGEDYSCGIDTAYGLGQEDEDRTVVSMDKNRFGSDSDRQVAELTSIRLNSAQVVGPAACMAAYYGERTKDHRGVKFAIEQITGPGDTCQNQLKLMGFNYHHRPRRYDSKKVKDDTSKKEGWYSSGWSVPILMTRFIEAVNGGWYEPASKWLIEELKSLERHVTTGGKAKMEHRSGQHDDRVRAAAQAFFTVHDLDDLAERAQKRYALPAKKMSPSKRICAAAEVGVGDWD